MLDPNRSDGYVECAIHRNRNRCPGYCDVEGQRSRHWTVDVTRIASVERDDRPFASGDPSVLRTGQALTVGHFRCTSRAAGLTCVSRDSGHGFFLSKNNKSQRLF
jgi:hypothetical protein